MLRLTWAVPAILALAATAMAQERLTWRDWSPEIFETANVEQRLVLLDLEAVWCHWCHEMERTTYQDPRVVALLSSKFITIRADQDANPGLSNRYGDWGWPATILFASDGTELAKLRGYVPPERMAAILEAFIKDPTPGPSAAKSLDITPARSTALSESQRDRIVATLRDGFDEKHGGWGTVHRFIDTDLMDWALAAAERGDAFGETFARKTLGGALNLIDREWGGIYQYSDRSDWSSPHFEKIMWYQANALRQYATAYAFWDDAKYRKAADTIYRYLTTRLLSPDGAFFTSQDADVDENLNGRAFYALDKVTRDAAGRAPRIDKNIYAGKTVGPSADWWPMPAPPV